MKHIHVLFSAVLFTLFFSFFSSFSKSLISFSSFFFSFSFSFSRSFRNFSFFSNLNTSTVNIHSSVEWPRRQILTCPAQDFSPSPCPSQRPRLSCAWGPGRCCLCPGSCGRCPAPGSSAPSPGPAAPCPRYGGRGPALVTCSTSRHDLCSHCHANCAPCCLDCSDCPYYDINFQLIRLEITRTYLSRLFSLLELLISPSSTVSPDLSFSVLAGLPATSPSSSFLPLTCSRSLFQVC